MQLNASAKFEVEEQGPHLWSHAASTALKLSIFFGLVVRSMGVIYGDIGTSPLYVMTTMFPSRPADVDDYIAGCSLVIWSILLLVLVKYVSCILFIDNHGEGGVFALGALLMSSRSSIENKWAQSAIRIAMIVATALLLADGAFTPAISISSAVSGIAVYEKSLSLYVIPISVVLLVVLFAIQRFGTAKVGVAFGPVLLVWFACLFAGGVYRLTEQPRAFEAFNPWLGIKFLFRDNVVVSNVSVTDPVSGNVTFSTTTETSSNFGILGAVFLAVTGLEALYADLGHFSAWPIRVGFATITLPALLFQYLGQTAFLLNNPSQSANVFYLSFPPWALWPMIVLATLATIIASQGMPFCQHELGVPFHFRC